MKRIVLLFFCFTVCNADPGNVDAFLWNYTVSGTIENVDDHTQFTVSGNMIIDDTLRLWDPDPGSPASPAPPVLGNAQYSYFIAEYSLGITEVLCPGNEYAFFGAGGSFYMERPAPWGMGDIQWDLVNGSGDWNSWHGEHFYWYHENMTPYDLYNEMDELAPIIQLTCLDLFGDPIFSDCPTCDILLTRTVPVPEPSTMLLVGTGLIGLAGLRRRFRKSYSNSHFESKFS